MAVYEGPHAQQQSTKQKLLMIVSLAVPAMVENLLQTVVGFVDILFVAKIGLTEVTAVGVANTVLAVYMAIFMALGVGTSSLIARNVGAGNVEQAKRIARDSTMLSIFLGIVFGIITLLFTEPMLQWMGAEPDVLADGVVYLQIVGISSVFISCMLHFGSILRASGDTKTPMKVSWWINILHIGLDYVLIFGFFFIPELGVAGAAWATVIVRIIGSISLFIYIQKSKLSFRLDLRSTNKANSQYSSLIKLSTPAAMERLILRFGQVLYFGFIVWIGTNTFAAHTIAGNIETFSYMPGIGLATAAAILVGQNMGARRTKEAYHFGWLTAGIAVVFMSFVGVILYTMSPWFARWFTTDAAVIDMVVTALRIDAFAQPMLAIGLVMASALQSVGDTKSSMYSAAIGMWLIRVIGVYVLGVQMEMGIAGIWLTIAIDLALRALFLSYRYRQFFRRTMLNEQKENHPSSLSS